MDYRDADLHAAGSESKKAETGAGDFLRGLRQLRKQAGLGHAELAARAHYPREVIKTAESGPSLPDLPLLAAFVRGCGGSGADVAEWEDWWRTAAGVPAVPLLPGRAARHSHPATAGWAAVPGMRSSAEGPPTRDVPRRPSAPTVAEPGPRTVPEPRRPVREPRRLVLEPRRTVSEPERTVSEPERTMSEPGPRGMSQSSEQPAMSDFALAMVVIAASAVCALAILTTIFA